MQGTVTHFDAHVGLGTIRGDDGRDFPFHCTQIADGTRLIAVGALVEFNEAAGPLGRWEASEISSR
jgi:cold shock CspA family protein